MQSHGIHQERVLAIVDAHMDAAYAMEQFRNHLANAGMLVHVRITPGYDVRKCTELATSLLESWRSLGGLAAMAIARCNDEVRDEADDGTDEFGNSPLVQAGMRDQYGDPGESQHDPDRAPTAR